MNHPEGKQVTFPLGVVLKGHGLLGEIKVRRDLYDTSTLLPPFRAMLTLKGGAQSQIEVTAMRSADGSLLITAAGITDRAAADALRGAQLAVDRSEFESPGSDGYYLGDLVGYQVVLTGGNVIGTIREVWDMPANEVLAVDGDTGEVLIPLIDDVVQAIDHARRAVVITPMEGLLD